MFAQLPGVRVKLERLIRKSISTQWEYETLEPSKGLTQQRAVDATTFLEGGIILGSPVPPLPPQTYQFSGLFVHLAVRDARQSDPPMGPLILS